MFNSVTCTLLLLLFNTFAGMTKITSVLCPKWTYLSLNFQVCQLPKTGSTDPIVMGIKYNS